MVRGGVLVVAGTLLALFLSASSLEALRFSPGAIVSFRLIALAVFAALVYQFLVRPQRRQVSDTQVAMYLEENDPKLEAAILSAIEATSGSVIAQDHSPHLVNKLVEQAIAVNIDPAEEDLATIDPAELVAAVTGHAAAARASVLPSAAEAEQIDIKEAERKQSFWWYLLVTGLLLLAAETVVSNRLSQSEKFL